MTIGYERTINSYGEPVQQSLTQDPYDIGSINTFVLGVVLDVNQSDSDTNRSAYQRADRRGYITTCTVQVISGAADSYFVLDNVIITTDVASGIDHYQERQPRGCTGLVTGEAWNSSFNNINPYDLDGDWCIVGFLGGNLDNPFIVRWWPHPRSYEAATSGQVNPSDPNTPQYLDQAGRYFERINGVEYTVTKQGDIYLSTYRANSALKFGTPLVPEEGRFPRTLNPDVGGSIKAWIKPTQSFEMDWNAPANGAGVLDMPDPQIPQDNPVVPTRVPPKDNTYIVFDSDRAQFELPEKFEVISKQSILLTSTEATTLTVGTNYTLDANIIDLAGPGGLGSPGSLTVDTSGVVLGSGVLGGVVGGTLFTAAFTTFAASIATAAASATTGAPAYAAAVTAAVSVLAASLVSAVSLTTRTG